MVVRYDAICSECGSACEVPFQPNPYKPVLCPACYGRARAPSAVAPKRVSRVIPPPRVPVLDLDNASEADMAMVRAVLLAVTTWREATSQRAP